MGLFTKVVKREPKTSDDKIDDGSDEPLGTIDSSVLLIEKFLGKSDDEADDNRKQELLSFFEINAMVFLDNVSSVKSSAEYVRVMLETRRCFPDLAMEYDDIILVDDAKETSNTIKDIPNVVVVRVLNARLSGTHTGPAFSPRHNKFPPIETTGKRVETDAHDFTFYVNGDSGKIARMGTTHENNATYTGPQGFYELIKQQQQQEGK